MSDVKTKSTSTKTKAVKQPRKGNARAEHAKVFAEKRAAQLAEVNHSPGHYNKLTAAVIDDILTKHAAGRTLQSVCREHNVSTVAWFKMLAAHRERGTGPELLAAWEEAREQFTIQLELHAESLALQADTRFCTMLIFMLKARKPEVYGDRMQHNGKVEVGFAEHFAAAMQRAVNGERPDSASVPAATH